MKVNDVPDAVFLVLIGLCSGEVLDARGGELVLLSGGHELPVPVEVLDALETFGWAVVTERGAVPTRNGRAALKEWLRKRFPGRRADVSRLRPAKFSAVRA